ncbi:type II toxin-antitoxin system VapC family toxin [Candidatus Woesearchaeota archaeon]|nr:type II toxin-antitoxin system VapC family toxin [Candidatus Woesearchaeota archaeon]
MIVLDTSAVIELLDGTKQGSLIKEQLLHQAAAITTITIHELFIGTSEKHKPVIEQCISTMQVLPFDEDAAYASVQLENNLLKRGKPLSKMDSFIAAICLSRNLPLITADRGFRHVHELDVHIF